MNFPLKPYALNYATTLLLSTIFLISCKEDVEDIPAIKFVQAGSTFSESSGFIDIQVIAAEPVSSNTDIYFSTAGSAKLNGDYTIETPSPITMLAGQQTVNIKLRIIDDFIINDNGNEIHLSITSIGKYAILTNASTDLLHTITIENNDIVNPNRLQSDLSWDIGDGIDIDQVNLDLYIATNVVIENNTVTNSTIYDFSKRITGYETLWISANANDGAYYIVVNYSGGTNDIEFTLDLNGLGINHKEFNETFTRNDVGSAIFYGPFTKSGSTFARLSSMQLPMKSIRGKLPNL